MRKRVTSIALSLCLLTAPALAKKSHKRQNQQGDVIENHVSAPGDPVKLHVKVYPNPSSGGFNVTLETEFKRVKVELLDITGKRIQSIPVFTEEGKTLIRVDLSDYPDGIYLLQLESEGEVRTVQLIKKQNY